jgi:hypothetical protein
MLNQPPPLNGNGSSNGNLDNDTAAFLMNLYMKKRIDYQYDYYHKRYHQFDKNSDLLFRANALLIAITTLLAALGTNVANFSGELRLLTALLPAFAGLLTSIAQLYKWDEQSRIYRDSVLGLDKARLLLPATDTIDTSKAPTLFRDLVKSTEQVFLDEVNQWGQISIVREESTQDAMTRFEQEYGLVLRDKDGNINEQQIAAMKQFLSLSQGTTIPQAAGDKLTIEKAPDDDAPPMLPPTVPTGNQATLAASTPSKPPEPMEAPVIPGPSIPGPTTPEPAPNTPSAPGSTPPGWNGETSVG